MALSLLLIALGFGLLIKGADFLVSGSSSIAKRFKVSDLVIGLTIVSFGTSAPELLVSILSNVNGASDIAIGNVLGSNTANILLILGVAALIYPLSVQKSTTWKEIPFSVIAALVLFFLANDALIDRAGFSILTRIDGLVLLVFFAIFLYYTFGIARNGEAGDDGAKTFGISKSVWLIILGLAALGVGGKLAVDNAVKLATLWGVSEALIGLTIVAVGTSLPELFTSAIAAFRKNADIAVGNVVGSNIFNIFWILGLSAIVGPLPFRPSLNFDIYFVIISSVLLFAWMFIGKKHKLERWQGGVFVSIYVAYLVYLIIRG